MSKSWFPNWSERNRDVEHFRGLKTQVDSLFEDWFGRSMGGVLAPRVDVAEDDKVVTLTAELPGVNEKDIDVSLVGDQLTIKGEKRSEHEEKKDVAGHLVHRTERSYGAFQRTLTVPIKSIPARSPRTSRTAFSRSRCPSRPMPLPKSRVKRSKLISRVPALVEDRPRSSPRSCLRNRNASRSAPVIGDGSCQPSASCTMRSSF